MNSFVRYICAVAFIMAMPFSASATNVLNPAELSPVQRTDIGEDISHYTFEITLDTDPYNKIRLHRFIREPEPYHPIPDVEGLLLLPGQFCTVVGTYGTSLISEHATWDHSLL